MTSDFVFEAVQWNLWHRGNQVADCCSIIDIILHLRAGRTFFRGRVNNVIGSFRGLFSTAPFVQPPASIRSFLVDKRSLRPIEPVAKFFATFVISSSAFLPCPKLTAECIGKLVLSARAKQQCRYVHFDVGTGPQACGETPHALPTNTHLPLSCHDQLDEQA